MKQFDTKLNDNDMVNFNKMLDDFGKLSVEQISEKFYDILGSLFDVIKTDVDAANTTNTSDASEKDVKEEPVVFNNVVKEYTDPQFDYVFEETLTYNYHDAVHKVDDFNEEVFNILDLYTFKMLVQGNHKTCKLTIIWNLENENEFTFTFYWDPDKCRFYGYTNTLNVEDHSCLCYNEQTRGFNKIYKSTLSDYMKTLIPEKEKLDTTQSDESTVINVADTEKSCYFKEYLKPEVCVTDKAESPLADVSCSEIDESINEVYNQSFAQSLKKKLTKDMNDRDNKLWVGFQDALTHIFDYETYRPEENIDPTTNTPVVTGIVICLYDIVDANPDVLFDNFWNVLGMQEICSYMEDHYGFTKVEEAKDLDKYIRCYF